VHAVEQGAGMAQAVERETVEHHDSLQHEKVSELKGGDNQWVIIR